MIIVNGSKTYTADDEEPVCSRCDNFDKTECYAFCGSEHGWWGYRRTASDDEND